MPVPNRATSLFTVAGRLGLLVGFSVHFQRQPKSGRNSLRRKWNRFWNREPPGPGTVSEEGWKTPMKSVVGVKAFALYLRGSSGCV
jgi:hypothetical protein